VSLFGQQDPYAFGKFNRAFMTMFKITAGDTWVDEMPFVDETGGLNQVRKDGGGGGGGGGDDDDERAESALRAKEED
jgi:hypothetical protein